MSTNRAVLYPYSLQSESATLIAAGLNTKKVRADGTYIYRPGTIPINWGNSSIPKWGTAAAITAMLNKPQYVRIASHKVATFEQLQGALGDKLPKWTTSQAVARGWLENPQYKSAINAVVCRTLTRANSGRGIVLAKTPAEVVPAPLYTLYKPKTKEFRVHVSARFGVIDVVQKKKRTDITDEAFNQYIRSHDNGWVFCREGIVVPPTVKETSSMVLDALHLDFGAVDIGFHEKLGIAVYEVNTAPGIEGQTLSSYVNLFRRYLGEPS